GHDDLRRREFGPRAGKAERDASGEARGHTVGEAGDGRLLVNDDRYAADRGGQHDGQRDEAAGGEDHARAEPTEPDRRLSQPHGNAECQIVDVAPRPVAPKLPRVDRVVRDPAFGHEPRLDPVTAADPRAGNAPRAEHRSDGEAWARMPARSAACN